MPTDNRRLGHRRLITLSRAPPAAQSSTWPARSERCSAQRSWWSSAERYPERQAATTTPGGSRPHAARSAASSPSHSPPHETLSRLSRYRSRPESQPDDIPLKLRRATSRLRQLQAARCALSGFVLHLASRHVGRPEAGGAGGDRAGGNSGTGEWAGRVQPPQGDVRGSAVGCARDGRGSGAEAAVDLDRRREREVSGHDVWGRADRAADDQQHAAGDADSGRRPRAGVRRDRKNNHRADLEALANAGIDMDRLRTSCSKPGSRCSGIKLFEEAMAALPAGIKERADAGLGSAVRGDPPIESARRRWSEVSNGWL